MGDGLLSINSTIVTIPRYAPSPFAPPPELCSKKGVQTRVNDVASSMWAALPTRMEMRMGRNSSG